MSDPVASHKLQYRPDIDGLRGLSILLVLIFHAFPSHLAGGYLGVDIFFVISGYLITKIIVGQFERKQFSIFNFYSRRIRRLFPALVIVLAACLVLGWFSLYANEFQELGLHVFSGSVFYSNFTYLGEAGYFDTHSDLKVLLHLWSLSIEEQFYLFWPFILFIGSKSSMRLRRIILLILFISLYYNIHILSKNPTIAFFSPFSRAWELALGGILVFIESDSINIQIAKYRNSLSLFAGLFICAGLIYAQFKFDAKYSKMVVVLPVVGTAVLILAGQMAILNRMVFEFKPLVWIGKLSYPLYLWHWPLLVFLRITNPNNLTVGVISLTLGISFVFAGLTHYLLEKPFQNPRSIVLKNSVLIAAMAMLGLGGFVVFKKQGVPQRAAAEIGANNVFGVPNLEKCDELKFRTVGDDYCHISESGPGDTALVIGDSHANGFSAILSNYAKKYNFSFIQIGRGSCPSLIEDDAENCAEVFQKSKELLDSKPKIQTVFLAARWSMYIDHKKFKERLFRTIEYYLGRQLKVVIFLAVPNVNNPSLCIPRPFQMNLPEDCNTPIQASINFERNYRDIVSEAKQKFPQIVLLDPWPYLCSDTICVVQNENGIIYSDVSHISKYGAKFLSQKFENKIAHEILDLKEK
jgi:peptidoglycan/LPS O-acetylase OafA/YrhL